MDMKRILKQRLTVLFATTMVMGSISAALMVSGCSADAPKPVEQASAQSNTASEKAAAEAEAAEEEFAKAKNSKTGSAKRHVASVHSKKASGDQAYVVQVGTFAVEENANKIASKLKAAGLPVFTKKIERASGLLYAVRIEPTPNRSEAEKFVSSVKAATGEASLILSVGR